MLLDFINTNADWETILSSAPYNLKINRDEEYIILKYNIGTDFSQSLTHEARGVILKEIADRQYKIVCHPFDKFFNYGESYAAEIDWNSAIVREKIDGSLIKLWYDNNWHISTNGCIDAYSAPIGEGKITFGLLFDKTIIAKEKLLQTLNPNHIYMFELVGPENPLVVQYDKAALYYLGERDRETDQELYDYKQQYIEHNIQEPKKYNLNQLSDVIDFANSFDENHEGCVVCDKDFNRIKVKGQAYLEAFFYRCQSSFSTKRIVTAIQNETIDDWISYSLAIKERYDIIMMKLRTIGESCQILHG